ncbi:MAG: CAP domain-containing protein [Actinobacteria bacterium]|nr:CAP domain-containing protein [Actinomycetota bacterium]
MLAVTRRTSRIAAAAAAAATLALVAPGSAAAARCHGARDNPNNVSLNRTVHATLCLLNKRRATFGLVPFHENGDLDGAAVGHADDMAANHYFAHGDFIGRIRSSNYLSGAGTWSIGENIAWGSWTLATPKAIVYAWMHSPEHRANILNGSFTEIGIGIARGAPVGGVSDGATYVTDFGTRG